MAAANGSDSVRIFYLSGIGIVDEVMQQLIQSAHTYAKDHVLLPKEILIRAAEDLTKYADGPGRPTHWDGTFTFRDSSDHLTRCYYLCIQNSNGSTKIEVTDCPLRTPESGLNRSKRPIWPSPPSLRVYKPECGFEFLKDHPVGSGV